MLGGPPSTRSAAGLIFLVFEGLNMKLSSLFVTLLISLTLLVPVAGQAAANQEGKSPAGKAQNVLRVCADPNYLPYSNRAGQGFENEVAETVAKAMHRKLKYQWASERGQGGFSQFLSANLDAGKCDVVMDIPYGSMEELTTNPYYVSSYVFVFKKAKHYDISSMDSPVLRKVKVGFEAGTPPETGLKLRRLVLKAKAFHIADTEGESPRDFLQAVQNGKVDIMITWEPAIGAFLSQYPDLEVVAVPNERATGSPEQYSFPMAMAVRKGDKTLKNKLDRVIKSHKSELKAILKKHGVKLYVPQFNEFQFQ
jgi:mxaJ protein